MDFSVVDEKAADLEPKMKKIKREDSPFEEVCEEVPEPAPDKSLTDKLYEDVLVLIFSIFSLSTRDLLNFRCVNKCWRNAATSALLGRKACQISLKYVLITRNFEGDEGDGTNYHGGSRWNVCQRGFENRTISELTHLMNESPKFPANKFCLHTPLPKSEMNDYSYNPELLRFFQHHGEKITTFRCSGNVSLEPLLYILYTYTPNIDCLDVSESTLFSFQGTLNEKVNEETSSSKFIPVKSLSISSTSDGPNFSHTMQLLLSSFRNLSCIENVHIDSLSYILNEGKGHLIKDFIFLTPSLSPATCVNLLQELALVNPQFYNLTLNLLESCLPSLPSISRILESSKDTLRQLEWSFQSYEYPIILKMIPLKSLKTIILIGNAFGSDETEGHENEGPEYSIFEDEMSGHKCFPSLNRLRLIYVISEKQIRRFFQFKIESDGCVRNCLPQVDLLDINYLSLPRNSEHSLFSKFFPNLRKLQVVCQDFKNLDNSFWTIFPSVKFLTIRFSCDGSGNELISFTDKLFTGFTSEMCQKLRTNELSESLNTPEGLESMRIKPSICKMSYLKELKLSISGKLHYEFASRVTGVYAFAKMPKTQVFISYGFSSDEDWSPHAERGEEINQAEHVPRWFEPIRKYVTILPQKHLLE